MERAVRMEATTMRRRSRRSVRPLLVLAVVTLAIAGLTGLPAGAHSFTKNDGNDSPGKLDLRSVSVGHTKTGVVHTFRTYEPWTAKSLGADSYFLVQIDKNNDRTYERCAFIFFDARLRGVLSNCRAQIVRTLPVVKLSPTAAKVTIPTSQTGSVYWWAGVSIWDGAAPCRNGCVDFSPNVFPDLLHDLIRPVVTMPTTEPLRVWEESTSSHFVFPFNVTDQHSGIRSWTVQRWDGSVWTNVVSGGGPSGAKEPPIDDGVEGSRMQYRVVAVDKQGNRKVGPSRLVYIPTDDATLDPESFSPTPPTEQEDLDSFGGTYSQMAAGEVFTHTFSGPDCVLELIGPGSGNWTVDVSIDGILDERITAPGGGQRQVLYHDDACGAAVYAFTVKSGNGFAVDAVLG
jgi:hypothetical protein